MYPCGVISLRIAVSLTVSQVSETANRSALLSHDELEEDDEVFIEEPPPKRPSKQDLCHAIDVLQTFSLFVRVDHDSFKTNIKNISRIVDRDRLVEKRQGLLTYYFSKTE